MSGWKWPWNKPHVMTDAEYQALLDAQAVRVLRDLRRGEYVPPVFIASWIWIEFPELTGPRELSQPRPILRVVK